MKATCTKCNFSDEVPDTFQGKTVRCPQCATEIKLIDTSKRAFELVEEPSESLPQKTQPACDINVNVQTQPKEVVEHDIYTLRTMSGDLKLTTRHLRGEFKAKITEKGYRRTIETSIDTLLSGVVGFHIETESNKGIKVFLSILAICGLIGGIGGFVGGIPILGIFFIGVAFCLLTAASKIEPTYDFTFVVTGKEYAIDISEGKVKEVKKFIEYLKDAKSKFERSI